MNKNIVVVLFCGRPLDIREISQKARAVLVVWRLFAAGDMTWSVVLIPLLLVVELVFLRKWCTRFCRWRG